jgi:hypothetical protein
MKPNHTRGGEIMKKLMKALSELQQNAEKAGKEIANMEGFNPKKEQERLVSIMHLIEDLSIQIESFFQKMIDTGKAPLTIEFPRGTPHEIFGKIGLVAKDIKKISKKPPKKKETSKKKSPVAA